MKLSSQSPILFWLRTVSVINGVVRGVVLDVSPDLLTALVVLFASVSGILGAHSYSTRQTAKAARENSEASVHIIERMERRVSEVERRNDDLERRSDIEAERVRKELEVLSTQHAEAVRELSRSEGIIGQQHKENRALITLIDEKAQMLGAREQKLTDLAAAQEKLQSELDTLKSERDNLLAQKLVLELAIIERDTRIMELSTELDLLKKPRNPGE